MFSRIYITFIAILFTLTTSVVFAEGKGPGAYPGANGVPFQNLQAQIDQARADLDELEESASISLADIEADINNLQAQISSNDADIAALQTSTGDNADAIAAIEDEIADLQAELLSKQDILDGPCAPGSSLRVIYPDGSFLCESDDVGTGGIISNLVSGSALMSTDSIDQPRSVRADCPPGWRVSGGGFESHVDSGHNGPHIQKSRPWNNGWLVQAAYVDFGPAHGHAHFRAVAMCIRTN